MLLSPDRGTAQIVETDGRRAEVNLAPDKDLLCAHRSQRRHRRSALPTAGSLATSCHQPDLPLALLGAVLPLPPCPVAVVAVTPR